MPKENFNIVELVNNSGCFDLQFRKDTRHERTGSPTYYRWKIQFVVTLPKGGVKDLQKLKKVLGCGNITVAAGQARFSVQNIDEVCECVIPYLKKNPPNDGKKKDFELWHKSAEIICKNKGVKLAMWEKNDLKKLLEIHRMKNQYKQSDRTAKWMGMAKVLSK